jgi:hypothetical protein
MLHLPNFEIQKQQTGYTCGLASICMVCSYLGTPLRESEIDADLIVRSLHAVPPARFTAILRAKLPEYRVRLANPTTEDVMPALRRQLEKNLPIPVIYTTVNVLHPPGLVNHYAVVIGMDQSAQCVQLANPFGYLETLSFSALLEQLAFANYTSRPFSIRLALALGVLKKNMLFLIDKSR